MKQLLIVSDSTYAHGISADTNSKKWAKDLSVLSAGAIALFKLDTNEIPSTAFADNFGIALGQGKGPAFVIPEVDFHTLKVVKAAKQNGTNFSATITVPTISENGGTYTAVLVKKGAVPHERNTWTATETVFNYSVQDDDAVAAKLGAYFQAMVDSGSLDITVSVSDNVITITGKNYDQWELLAGDDLPKSAISVSTVGKKATNDKAYIEDLAQQCAAGKGFTDTYRDGDTIYPGYPEAVADTTYTLYTLRFAVGRKSAKTRDERVSQLVHIAVPTAATGVISALDTALGIS